MNVSRSRIAVIAAGALIGSLVLTLPASSLPRGKGKPLGSHLSTHVSQQVALRHWMANPDTAPAPLRERIEAVRRAAERNVAARPSGRGQNLFNRDGLGLPQNEESISACRQDPRLVLGSTNDYRGLVDPQGNFTGWHFSTDGGATVANEGLLPPVRLATGDVVPSGGDPVDVFVPGCRAYAASLAYDPVDPFNNPNGIAAYRSDPTTLASCPGGPSPACWPVRRAVATSKPGHFLDKEWLHAGVSGRAGLVVWVTYSDFVIDPAAPLGFTSASIKAVRCNASLSRCTHPILISGDDRDVQFSDVTVGPDGRVYVTWSEIIGELPGTPGYPAQTFVHKLRIAPAGSTEFGPEQIIARERQAIPFGGFLQANDFRVATYVKSEVAIVNGRPRVFAVWDACNPRVLDSICEFPVIKLTWSDNDGVTWARQRTISAGGVNYFPTISWDRARNGQLALAWFTNRYDPAFHNRQDVELIRVDPVDGSVDGRQRLTRPSNESEADPLLGGFFIGDYIEVFAHRGVAWVHYNANYRQIRLLGDGRPVNQQDNFLARRSL
jgi:hypothetical protein